MFQPKSEIQTFEEGLFSYGGGYFQFFTKNRPQNHQKRAILHTSQANGGARAPPPPPGYATGCFRNQLNFSQAVFFYLLEVRALTVAVATRVIQAKLREIQSGFNISAIAFTAVVTLRGTFQGEFTAFSYTLRWLRPCSNCPPVFIIPVISKRKLRLVFSIDFYV